MTHHAEESQIVLPRLWDAHECFDLAFVDGNHRFDWAFVDLFYLGRLVRHARELPRRQSPCQRRAKRIGVLHAVIRDCRRDQQNAHDASLSRTKPCSGGAAADQIFLPRGSAAADTHLWPR